MLEETELLRDFAAAAPWPIWAKSVEGNLRYANAAYVRATEGASVADAIHRNLELLENDQRAEMGRVLNDNATFSARLPIVVGGERRIYDVQALKLSGGSAGIAIDASEATALARRRWSGWRKRIAAPSTSCRRALPCSTASGGLPSTMNPIGGCGASTRPSSTPIPTIPACSTGCARRANCPSSRTSGPGRPSCTKPIAPSSRRTTPGILPDGRAVSVVTTPNLEGGVTYLFDNVTESLDLARRFDGLTRVQRETLDNLAEAVAVFGSNGRVATVQSRLRENVEAVGGSAEASSRTSRPWKPGASRCSTTR